MERFEQLQAAIAKLEEDAVKCKKRFCQEEEEWKKCFRRNRIKYHPDKKGGDEETFKDLGICDDADNNIMALRAMEDEAREMAEREAAEAALADLTWLEETDTQTDDIGTASEYQTDDIGTASEYSDSDGEEYPQESTATSPSRRIGRVETSPKPRLQNSTSPNMTRIFNKIPGTMKYRVDRSASRRRRVETKEQLEETKEDTTREIRPREVIRLENDVIRLNNERAAARERERRRALDDRESRAEVSQNCCWTLTFI
jgi:hypothetical protein